MISVAYDVTSLAQSPYGGIARVCRHTLEQAAGHPDVEADAFYRRGDPSNIMVEAVPIRRSGWFDRFLPRQHDIVHALCHRLPPLRGRILVYTLYDAWSLYPNKYQSPGFQKPIGKRMRHDLDRADAVICISESTRRKLLELEIVDSAKCHVALMGASSPESDGGGGVSKEVERCSSRPFVLFVGRVEVRKNIGHIIKAVLPLSQLDLVIVGEPGYGYEEIADTVLPCLTKDRLHILNRLSETDLDWLYRHALATLLPSWEEGFGLPILEAMVRGCPVITSNCSASAEVGTGGAILTDPREPSQSTEALLRLSDDSAYRDKIVRDGLERSTQFGWENYFGQLVGIYGAALR